MRCHDIHENDCDTELAPDWKFCPRCGRRAGSVRIEDVTLRFPFKRPLPLTHRGTQPVAVEARLHVQSPEEKVLRLLSPGGLMSPSTLNALHFRWEGAQPPPIGIPLRVALWLRANDGPPQDPFEPGDTKRLHQWPTLLRVSSPSPPRLHVLEDMLLFGPHSRERIVTIANDGDAPLTICPLEEPHGYTLAIVSPPAAASARWVIAPGERREWRLRAIGDIANGEESRLEVMSADGRQRASVRLLRSAGERAESTTTHIVGVDFGTSGTSVWVRSGKEETPAMKLKDPGARDGDDPYRFPTLIYVRVHNGVEEPNGFYIGYAALREYEKTPNRGFLVRELKSDLRSDREPYLDYGPGYTLHALLTRYLKTLKSQVIDLALGDPARATVAWNFSLPVLDSHRGGARFLFERQKNALDKAIRAAGYLTSGVEPQFFTEPYCAAVYLLLGYGDFEYAPGLGPQPGEWACVFDSGGGTTDVVLGRLWREDGKLKFEEVTTLGGYKRDEAPGEVTTFGGESLTRRTALYLAAFRKRKYDYLSYTGNGPKDTATYERMMHLAETLGERGIAGLNEDGTRGDSIWNANPKLMRETDGYKKRIARLRALSALENLNISGGVKGDRKLEIVRREWDANVVEPRLEPLGEEMSRSVFCTEANANERGELPLPSDVKWVFGVGGNTRTRRIQEWLEGYFPNGVQVLETQDGDDSDRMLAVSGGTVWAAKARRANALPYALWIEAEDGKKPFEVAANDALSDATPFRDWPTFVPANDRVLFTVWADGRVPIGNSEVAFRGRVGEFTLFNATPEGERRAITLHFRFRGRTLVVESDESGQSAIKWEYML